MESRDASFVQSNQGQSFIQCERGWGARPQPRLYYRLTVDAGSIETHATNNRLPNGRGSVYFAGSMETHCNNTTDSLTVAARFTLLAAWRPIATGGPVTTVVHCAGK